MVDGFDILPMKTTLQRSALQQQHAKAMES
jgi:hypothetical protein